MTQAQHLPHAPLFLSTLPYLSHASLFLSQETVDPLFLSPMLLSSPLISHECPNFFYKKNNTYCLYIDIYVLEKKKETM